MSNSKIVLKKLALELMELDLTDEIIESGKLFHELGIDSLDSTELMMELEDELEIELTDVRVDAIKDIKSLVEYLAEFD